MNNKATIPALPSSAKFASAVGASLAASFETDAAVVYSGIQNLTVTVTSSSTSQFASIDIDGANGNDFRIRASFFTSSTSSPTSTSIVGSVGLIGNSLGNRPLNSSGLLIPVFPGSPIGSSDFMAPTIGTSAAAVRGTLVFPSTGPPSSIVQGFIPPGETALIALEFQSGPNTHYGWLRLRLNDYVNVPGTSIASGTIIDWAYEDTPDTDIQAGAIPEPSSLALLALGATGLGAVRRRKKH